MALVTQTFTSSTSWTVPAGIYLINDIFVLGGGGGGGWNGSGGGGGGGGVTVSSNLTVTPGATVNVVVGPGGAGATSYTQAGTGTQSSFGSVTAPGGQGGYSWNGSISFPGANDSRGGNSGTNSVAGTSYSGGSAAYSGIQSPGDGGARRQGGGGAGATQAGQNAGDYPGNGGNGFLLTWNNTTYGGGGGGGWNLSTTIGGQGIPQSQGGAGGGAPGGTAVTRDGGNASPNTGGGGGGASRDNSGNGGNGGTGGSGIVIIRYWEPTYTLTVDPPGEREDRSLTIRLRTTNVPNGASVGYTISGAGVTSSDFASGTLSGTITISSLDSGGNGTGTATVTLSPDASTEGNETVTFSLLNGFASVTVTIGDFSTGTLPSIETTKITATQYNTIRNKVVGVLGSGVGNSGYGQTVYSTAVSEGTLVTVNEWDRLRYDIINAWTHIYGTVPSGLVTVTGLVDTLIRGNNSTQPYSQYDSYANAIVAARFTQPSVANGQAFTFGFPKVQYASPWSTRIYSIVSVSFTSATAARYFFNSGGEIRFISSRSGGTGTTQDTSWTNLLTNAGTVVFGGALPVAGSGTDGRNFYRCTGSFQTMFIAQGSNAYASNTFKISVRTPGVANNSTGTASSIEFLVEWLDDHTGISGGPDSITGVTDLTVSKLQATGNLSPPALGAWVIEDPSVSIGAILT